jgi:serpin B
VWGQKSYPWEASFLDVLAQDYGAGVFLEDFAGQPDPARLAINAWVSDSTAMKIDDLLPPASIDADTRMVLVNAIHVKLPWATAFPASATMPASFTTAGGAVTMPFMNQTLEAGYVDDGAAQIVSLPLANDQLRVVVALPHGDLATYESGLSATSQAFQPLGTSSVALSLPKVTFSSPTFSLSDALQAMGMVDAFDGSAANFTGMCAHPPDGNLYVSDVLQKAMLGMQETGVEAAAATAVILTRKTAVAGPPVTMVVDRPFVVAIVDATGAILFLGHIEDPTSTGGP